MSNFPLRISAVLRVSLQYIFCGAFTAEARRGTQTMTANCSSVGLSQLKSRSDLSLTPSSDAVNIVQVTAEQILLHHA